MIVKPFILAVFVTILIIIGSIIIFDYQENLQSNSNADVEENKTFNSTSLNNLDMMPKEAINKNVLPGHVFGFTVDNTLTPGFGAERITEYDEKLSIRFTSRFEGEVTQIKLNLRSSTDEKIKIGIQEDNGGIPNGLWLGKSPGYVIATIDPEEEAFNVILLDDVKTESEKAYHIVIEPHLENTNPKFWLINYKDNWHFNPLNYTDPDNVWQDPMINTLFFDGDLWQVEEKWPSFVVEYSNGISDGQPYTLMAPWVIGEDRLVGQAVEPYSKYNVDEISFVVSKKGDPIDDLYYTIYNAEDNILREGVFANKSKLSINQIWHSVLIEPPLLLNSDKLYRIVLHSRNSTLDDGYFIYGHEFMLDKILGFGSKRHHLTASYDGGKNWITWDDADASFKLVVR